MIVVNAHFNNETNLTSFVEEFTYKLTDFTQGDVDDVIKVV